MYNGSTLTPQRFNFIPPIIDDVLLDSVGHRVHNVIHPFGINLVVFNFRHTSMKPFHVSIKPVTLSSNRQQTFRPMCLSCFRWFTSVLESFTFRLNPGPIG